MSKAINFALKPSRLHGLQYSSFAKLKFANAKHDQETTRAARATQIDEFNSTNLGGDSHVPVNSSSNPKWIADRNKTGGSNDYINYTLTSGGQWQTNSVNTTFPILMGEGVWVDNLFGSSQTWSVSLPIW